MKEKTEFQLFNEFEEKFGFKCYDSILILFNRLHQRINELKISRENWKAKYLELNTKRKGGIKK